MPNLHKKIEWYWVGKCHLFLKLDLHSPWSKQQQYTKGPKIKAMKNVTTPRGKFKDRLLIDQSLYAWLNKLLPHKSQTQHLFFLLTNNLWEWKPQNILPLGCVHKLRWQEEVGRWYWKFTGMQIFHDFRKDISSQVSTRGGRWSIMGELLSK